MGVRHWYSPRIVLLAHCVIYTCGNSTYEGYVTSAQMRAARGLVNWSVRDLSDASGVHRNTITNIETGKSGGDAETIKKLRSSLEAAGVQFIPENGGGAGVRLQK
ncbi:MAG: XRE family transcriptional regulator [Mesorhizobium sp.]|nr:MAG: XRE family transcriptional regulator [Mesorhizobium sp.]